MHTSHLWGGLLAVFPVCSGRVSRGAGTSRPTVSCHSARICPGRRVSPPLSLLFFTSCLKNKMFVPLLLLLTRQSECSPHAKIEDRPLIYPSWEHERIVHATVTTTFACYPVTLVTMILSAADLLKTAPRRRVSHSYSISTYKRKKADGSKAFTSPLLPIYRHRAHVHH